jgi:hypothetical protein
VVTREAATTDAAERGLQAWALSGTHRHAASKPTSAWRTWSSSGGGREARKRVSELRYRIRDGCELKGWSTLILKWTSLPSELATWREEAAGSRGGRRESHMDAPALVRGHVGRLSDRQLD